MTPVISVIMPIYCSEKYLIEAIESILHQTIGLEKIQLLLIDDGSDDSSPNICMRYANQFPENVLYRRKENGGVSSAINLGLSLATGKYIARLDSDDTWDLDAFSEIISFFDSHYDEIDCLSVRINIFGDKTYIHPLDFKYTSNRIVDLDKEPFSIQTTGGNIVFKTEAVTGLRFNETLKYLEDVYFNTQFIRSRDKYGVIANVHYNYRKSNVSVSLTNQVQFDRAWYLQLPHEVFFPLIEESKQIFGAVDKYTQSVIAYFLRWRISPTGINETLTPAEKLEYSHIIHMLLQEIDDDVIASIHGTSAYHRIYLYRLKYNCDIFELANLNVKTGTYRLNSNTIFYACGRGLARIKSVDITGSEIRVSGTSNIFLAGARCTLHVEDSDGNQLPIIVENDPKNNLYGFTGEIIRKPATFSFLLPEASNGRFKMYTLLNNDYSNRYYCTVTFDSTINGTYNKTDGAVLIDVSKSRCRHPIQRH